MHATLVRFIAVSSLLIGATAAYCSTSTVYVPFSFEANGKVMPAGAYEVNYDLQNRYLIASSKQDASKQFMETIRTTEPNDQDLLSLVFDNTGTVPVLYRVQEKDWSTPVLTKSHKKLELAVMRTVFAGK